MRFQDAKTFGWLRLAHGSMNTKAFWLAGTHIVSCEYESFSFRLLQSPKIFWGLIMTTLILSIGGAMTLNILAAIWVLRR
jgi:hypothetical protein